MISGSQTNQGWWVALVAVLGIFGGLSAVMLTWPRLQVSPGVRPADSILTDFGTALVNPLGFVIPFEVASVLLLAALIGAIYIAVERKGGRDDPIVLVSDLCSGAVLHWPVWRADP